MEIKVLGTGCAKCKKLYAETEKAVAQAGAAIGLTKVEKLEEIMSYGVIATPALVLDGQVKSSGKIPSANEILGWIKTAQAR